MKSALFGAILALSASGQTPTEPPTLIRLIRSEWRPAAAAGSIRPYFEGRSPVPVLGMSSVSGLAESWLMEMHDSFATIEDLDKALSSVRLSAGRPDPADDVLPLSRRLIAVYRPHWSYRSDQAIRMFPRAHYFHVTIYRVRPGAEADFAEMVRLRRLSFDSINLDRPDLVYQVISGAPSGTYMVLAPLASLRTLDMSWARSPAYAEGAGRVSRNVAADAEIGREHLLFRVEPRMSYVSEEFAGVDPEFWGLKPK